VARAGFEPLVEIIDAIVVDVHREKLPTPPRSPLHTLLAPGASPNASVPPRQRPWHGARGLSRA
jgi:hypothetical protein